jgi:predicted DNA-binding protein
MVKYSHKKSVLKGKIKMSKLIRVNQESYNALKKLEADLGIPKQEIIEKALEKLLRENLLEQANEAYEQLRNNPQAWASELEERKEWETTLSDGLDDL